MMWSQLAISALGQKQESEYVRAIRRSGVGPAAQRLLVGHHSLRTECHLTRDFPAERGHSREGRHHMMSASPRKADIDQCRLEVGFVPISDACYVSHKFVEFDPRLTFPGSSFVASSYQRAPR